jgi:hypothetical protein
MSNILLNKTSSGLIEILMNIQKIKRDHLDDLRLL